MSTRGRKPDLQLVTGDFSPPLSNPEDTVLIPAAIPEEMRAEWLAIRDDLNRRNLWTEAVMPVVENLIQAMRNARLAQKAIDEHGPLVDAGKGILKQNPACSLLGKSQAQITRISAELGLTPASMGKGGKSKGLKDDDSTQPDLFNSVMDV